jgi:hypothetical protein
MGEVAVRQVLASFVLDLVVVCLGAYLHKLRSLRLSSETFDNSRHPRTPTELKPMVRVMLCSFSVFFFLFLTAEITSSMSLSLMRNPAEYI